LNEQANKMLGAFLSSYVSRISETLVYDKLFQTETAKLLQGLTDGEKLAIEAGLNLVSAAAASKVEGTSVLSTIVHTLLVDAGPEITRRMRMSGLKAEEYVYENLRSNPSAVMNAFDEAFSRQPPVLTAAEYKEILDRHGYTANSWSGFAVRQEKVQSEPKGDAFDDDLTCRTANDSQSSGRRRWATEGLSRTSNGLRRRRQERALLAERRSLDGRLTRLLAVLKRIKESISSHAKQRHSSN
jgi:hypothetical protein